MSVHMMMTILVLVLVFLSGRASPTEGNGAEGAFMASAYPVTWNHASVSPPSLKNGERSFVVGAYPASVSPPSPKNGEKSFVASAYPVKWDHASVSPPSPKNGERSFVFGANTVKWNDASVSPPSPKNSEKSFVASTYPVKWDHASVSPPSPKNGERSFVFSTNPVKWNDASISPPSPKNGEKSFVASAYPVKWDHASVSPPSPKNGKKSFVVSASPVKWDRASDSPPSPKAPAKRQHLAKVKTGVLFLKRTLYPGAVLPQGTKLSHVGAVGSQARADDPAVPFDYSYLGAVLAKYNIAQGSEKAEQVAETLRFCGEEANDHQEPHTCATSRRAATDFAAAALGTSEPRAVTTIVHGRTEPLKYVVARITLIGNAGAVVPCHPLPYPYDVYYCHRPSGVQALRVELVGDEDRRLGATAIAVCHSNTTDWDGSYFQLLGGVRSEAICHYTPQNYVLYVPT